MNRRANRGIVGRLNRLEGNAHNTMNQAQVLIAAVKEATLGFIENLSDGITLEVTRVSTSTIWDFFRGKTAKLPIGIKIIFQEETQEETEE